MSDDEFIRKLLKLINKYDAHDSLEWNSSLEFRIKLQ